MKLLKKYIHLLLSPFVLGLAVTVALASTSVVYYKALHSGSKTDRLFSTFLSQMHEKTVDWRMTDRGPLPGSPRVAILAIDEKSIEQEGRWPWPRDKMATLIDRTLKLGAKSVSFDIVFSEDDANSSLTTLTRLKRQLRDQNELPKNLASLIDQELAKADLDQSLGNLVSAQADHLIFGAFYEDYDRVPPYQDYCIDALFKRGAASRYWRKEAVPLTVFDDPLAKIHFPREVGDNLDGYFTLLEVQHSNTWFANNPGMQKRIAYALDEMGSQIPSEALPGLAVYWLNNDLESGQTIMETVNPTLANPEGVRRFYARFGAAFTKKERAELASEVRTAGASYCTRFFTNKDDLLSKANFSRIWGEGEEAAAFPDFSWEKLWPKIKSAGAASDTTNQIQAPTENFEKAIERIKTQSVLNTVDEVKAWTINIPAIADVTKHSGYFNAVQDTDGSIRRASLLTRRGNAYMPSLAFKTFLVDKGLTAMAKIDIASKNKKILRSLEVNDKSGTSVMRIPVDQSGHLMINYSGGRNTFPYISASDLFSDRENLTVEQTLLNPETGLWQVNTKEVKKRDFLDDKLLFIGATATGVYDLRVTPFEENYPGVETHANVLSNLLTEHARVTGEATDKKNPRVFACSSE